MIVTFCGHADFQATKAHEDEMLAVFKKKIGDRCAQMYLGGYGEFDRFSYQCCKKYKERNPNISLVWVTPYLSDCRLKSKKEYYDEILYPSLEDKPKRYSIFYRNKYMVEAADLVVAYVSHDWGGAYKTYKHARRMGKEIYNLAEFKE